MKQSRGFLGRLVGPLLKKYNFITTNKKCN